MERVIEIKRKLNGQTEVEPDTNRNSGEQKRKESVKVVGRQCLT